MGKKKKTNYNYCEACKRARRVYKTEQELNSRLDKEDKNALYPLNVFFCSSCEGWHVTRHPVVNGKETINENVLAWEQEMNQTRNLSTSIFNIIKKIADYLKWNQFCDARQLLSNAHVKVSQLRKIKDDGAVVELEKKIDSVEKSLIESLKKISKDDNYSQFTKSKEKKAISRKKVEQLSSKTIQKIDNMIEEAERLSEVNSNHSYALIRECQSQIERIKYGENLPEIKRQWTIRLVIIKEKLKKRE
jgi:hypothetical protein